MRKRILVTGGSGQLGLSIKYISHNYKKYVFDFVEKKKLDITKFELIKDYLSKNKYDFIINCAAFTNVDKAEKENSKSNLINNLAVENLANLSKHFSIALIHISTDYVFDGNNLIPYNEEDKVNPINFYGKSKSLGEESMKKINPKNSVIIRTSSVYSIFGNNFLKKIINLHKKNNKLFVVNDQIFSPTYSIDLASFIIQILPHLKDFDKTEFFHYCNSGQCSWYEFSKKIFDILALEANIKPVNSSFFKRYVPRPKFSVLNNEKSQKSFSLKIPDWDISLKNCLNLLYD